MLSRARALVMGQMPLVAYRAGPHAPPAAERDRDLAVALGNEFTRGGTSPDRAGTKAGLGRDRGRSRPVTIEGELIARSTGTLSDFAIGDRVFHQKFGNGNVIAIDGNKLVIQFDKAGEKRVVDSFVQRLMKH